MKLVIFGMSFKFNFNVFDIQIFKEAFEFLIFFEVFKILMVLVFGLFIRFFIDLIFILIF